MNDKRTIPDYRDTRKLLDLIHSLIEWFEHWDWLAFLSCRPYHKIRVQQQPRFPKRQKRFAYCPFCWFELMAGGHWTWTKRGGAVAYFRCANCHRASLWNMGVIQPYPLNLKESDLVPLVRSDFAA